MTRTIQMAYDKQGRMVVLQERRGKFDVTRMASTKFYFHYMAKSVSEDEARATFAKLIA